MLDEGKGHVGGLSKRSAAPGGVRWQTLESGGEPKRLYCVWLMHFVGDSFSLLGDIHY